MSDKNQKSDTVNELQSANLCETHDDTHKSSSPMSGFLMKKTGPLKVWHKKYLIFGDDNGLAASQLDVVIKKAMAKYPARGQGSEQVMAAISRALISTKDMILLSDKPDSDITGLIDLQSVKLITRNDSNKLFEFTLKLDNGNDIVFASDSQETRDQWVMVIEDRIKSIGQITVTDTAIEKLKERIHELKPKKLKKKEDSKLPSFEERTEQEPTKAAVVDEAINEEQCSSNKKKHWSLANNIGLLKNKFKKQNTDSEPQNSSNESEIVESPKQIEIIVSEEVEANQNQNSGDENQPLSFVTKMQEVFSLIGSPSKEQSEKSQINSDQKKTNDSSSSWSFGYLYDLLPFKRSKSTGSTCESDLVTMSETEIKDDSSQDKPEQPVESSTPNVPDDAASDEVTVKDQKYGTNSTTSTKKQLFKVPEFTLQQSYLKKQSQYLKAWNQRYFALSKVGDEFQLSYYRPDNKNAAADSFILSTDFKIIEMQDLRFILQSGSHKYHLMANNDLDYENWTSVLKDVYKSSE